MTETNIIEKLLSQLPMIIMLVSRGDDPTYIIYIMIMMIISFLLVNIVPLIKKIIDYFRFRKMVSFNYTKRSNVFVHDGELKYIEPIFRLRITFTNNHERIYSEDNVDLDILFMTRLIHNLNNIDPKNIFSYCFDIRDIYYVRNKPVIINNKKYYFQPDDHIRIINRWCRINNPNLVKYIR